MDKGIGYRSLVYLNKEQKRAKNALWNAIERKAPEQDIDNLKNKLEVLDHLIGLAIKEDEKMKTPEQFLQEVKQIAWDYTHDTEVMHSRLDEAIEELLTALGYGESVEYIRSLERWYA